MTYCEQTMPAWDFYQKVLSDVTQIIVSNPGAQTSNIQQDSIRVTRGIVADRAASLLGRGGEGPELAGQITATASR